MKNEKNKFEEGLVYFILGVLCLGEIAILLKLFI